MIVGADAIRDEKQRPEIRIDAIFAAIQQVADFVQVDPALVIESPFALVGTPDEMVDDLLRRRQRWGFTYVIVGAEDVESFAPVVAELAGH